jgi:hypothetical protein
METRTSAMKWLLVKTFFKKSFIWIKHHWQIPLVIIWSVVVYVMSRRNTDALVEVLATKKKSYEEQIDLLKSQHEKEIFERDKLIEQYHDLVAKIEAKYKEKEKQLSKKEKVRIKQIIKKSKGDADVIKKEIEESFGFTFVD